MKERPILMSGPMVRAIIEGRKTQTRRVMKDAPGQGRLSKPCVYGIPGDRLWVRETWSADHVCAEAAKELGRAPVHYRADGEAPEYLEMKWRPSIFMPRWASRITLEITDVRVQRLQEISEEDAQAEGVSVSVVDPSPRGVAPIYPKQYAYAKDCFHDLWDSINAKRGFGWDTNPWVWALTFPQWAVRP